MFLTATDGFGVWHGSFDGSTWLAFPCQPMPGDEGHIDANLDPDGDPSVVFARWKRQDVVTRDELGKRGFTFGVVETLGGASEAAT